MLKKTITGIIITVLIVSMMVIPVSAARYDYNEYIVNTGVDGENDILTMLFPTELNSWYVVDIHDSSRPIRKYYGENSAMASTSWFDDCPNDMFYMVYKPLGENSLKVDNVPNGSTLSMNITIDVKTTHLESCLLDPYMRIRYYDINGSYIGYSSAIYSEQGHIGDYWAEEVGTSGQVTFDSSTTISKPEGAVYAQFWFYIYVTPWFEPDGNSYFFEVKNGSTMTFGISSLYRLQESSGQTNQLLGDIKDQNNTLIQGTPEQNAQVSGSVGDLDGAGDKLGDLIDQMQVERPDTENMDVSIDKFIPGTSILAYTGPILAFWNNDSLKAMLIIVLTLVLVSWVMFGKKG